VIGILPPQNKLDPLEIYEVPVIHEALVIGGGAAGMNAALNLAGQGFPVHIIERKSELGGNLNQLHYFSGTKDAPILTSPKEYLNDLIHQIDEHPLITPYLNAELLETDGFKGNFSSTVQKDDEVITIRCDHHCYWRRGVQGRRI